MRPLGFVMLVLLVLGACGRGKPAAPAPAGPPPMAPFPAPTRIYYDNSGGIADSVRLVVKDAAEFERVWRQATSRQTSPPPVPAVDFTREMVIVVGAGQLTPEDQIAVDSVGTTRQMDSAGQMQETLSVMVQTTLACQRFQIEAYPLEIVRLRRFDGPIRIVNRPTRQAEGCRDGPQPRP